VRLVPLAVAGVYALDPEQARDDRGWFARTWDAVRLEQAGLNGTFVQQSLAWNARAGTVRGLHLAFPPSREVKLVRCVRGAALDVVVDARFESPTYGHYVAVQLDEQNHRALYVPAGCAHGYQTLVDGTELLYDISEPYRAELAAGIAHDDPALGIFWPLPVAALSARDAGLPSLAIYAEMLKSEVVI
jgi:dTDP-4-dehydrorhamnose 3,5-epimerase